MLTVMVLQAVAVGLLATGALGTAKAKLSGAAPQLRTAVAAAHDTSVPLADAPHVPLDPGRTFPEFERQTPSTVASSPHDPVLQTAALAPAIAATASSFPGLRMTALAAQYYPPDTVGDVGLTQYVQAVNGGLEVFGKTGATLTGAITDDSFWSGLSPCDTASKSDPTLNYDQFANRWVYSEITTGSAPYYECVAVSTSDDATDSWNRYAFDLGSAFFPDYPKLGVWPDGYYLSFNDFDPSYRGVGALALERSAMLNGTSAQMVFFDLSGVQTLPFGMLPADADGATPPADGAPELFAVPNDDPSAANNDQLGVWAFHVDWSAPGGSTFTNVQNLNVAPYDGIGLSVPQPGLGSPRLDALANDQLMNRLQYRNFGGYETLVANETVNNSGSDAPRWYELRRVAGSWSLNQEGTFAPDTVNRWLGSAAMNGTGDIALGYSAGDSATNPGLRFTGRLSTDPLGTLAAESTLQAGGGVQTGAARWGDYSQMTVDPSDDCTFWYTGEYYTGTASVDWATRIGSIRFGACTGPTGPTYSVVPTISGTTREGSTLTATAGTWSPAPTTTAYQWRRCDANGLTCVDIASATLSTYTLTAADAGKRLRVKVTVTAATGTSSVVSSSTAAILPLAPVITVLPAISGTPQLGQTLGTTTGTWASSLAPTYSYQWQRCTSLCANIGGANLSSYALTNPGDVGATIRVVVSATNAGGTGSATSVATSAVLQAPAPVNTVLPVISGAPVIGTALTVGAGTWSGVAPINLAFQWQTCSSTGTSCVALSGETGASYTVAASDFGNRLRVVVTGTNSGGSNSVNTAVTSIVVPPPPSSGGLPTLSGTAQVGQVMTISSPGTWSGWSPVTYAYGWQQCSSAGTSCSTISGATSTAYTLASGDQGKTVRGVVFATNPGGTVSAVSAPSAIVAAATLSSGTGSSSGGGGGSTPDLAVTGLASPSAPLPGDSVTYALTVTDKNLAPATRLLLTLTLPAGVAYVGSVVDRGAGCTATGSQVVCNLDYLSSDSPKANVQIFGKVTATGSQTLVAVATSDLGDLSAADNTLSLTLNATTAAASGVPAGLNGDGTATKTVLDAKAPIAHALSSAGKRGRTAALRFTIYDDSGVAKAIATVRRNGKVVGRVRTGFGSVAYGSVYFVGWRIPKTAPKGRYAFCVVAHDRSGHTGAASCGPLALK